MLSVTFFFRAVAAAVCLGGLAALPAYGMERVTLRSGMTVDCARHESLGDQMRLYTGHGREYQDVSFLQIVSIDYVPDVVTRAAPKPVMIAQPVVPAKAAPVKAAPVLFTPKPAPLYVAPKRIAPAFAAAVTAMQPAFPEMEVHELLQRAGSTYNIDAELLASIIHAESGGNTRATSRYGAKGLMQLMPSVGRTYGASDLYRPDQNVSAGTALLDALLRKYNDNLPLALAAYNAGPGAVARWHGVPPSTRGYVSRVMGEFYRRKLAMGAKPTVAPQAQAAKPVELAAAVPVPSLTIPAMKPVRAHGAVGAVGSSIHREWSGQRSFVNSR